jgi:microsomal dipeptidase-like Zn-dependent dipeptidase
MKIPPTKEMIEASLAVSVRSDFLSLNVSDIIDAVIWEQDAQKVSDSLNKLRQWHKEQIAKAKLSWWQRFKMGMKND